MKKIIAPIVLTLLSIAALSQSRNAEQAFIIKDKELIPEGMAHDPASGNFFVGSIQKNKIVKISPKGAVSDFITSGKDDVLQVLGMGVDGEGRLWACNNTPEHDTLNKTSNVHVYEVSTGKLVKKLTLRDGTTHLFNDLYHSKNGDTYITDSEGGAVYVVRKNSNDLEVFLPAKSLIYPNGITASEDESKLLVSSARGLVAVDMKTKKIQPIRHPRYFIVGLDGLYRHKNHFIAVQNVTFPEAVIRFEIDSNYEKYTSVKHLVSDLPAFDSPTTGVVAGDYFYFIANSQLTQINDSKDGSFRDASELTDPIIMKIKLN